MELFRYPLLCWQLTPDTICAHLVSTEYELAGTQLSKLQSHLAEHLQRDYIQNNFLPDSMPDARLKKINVKIRPAYQEENGVFPVGHTLSIPIAAVYGSTEEGYSECYLPLLEQHFYYYKPDQLRALIEYFSRDYFNNMTPEMLHRYIMLGEPWLEEVTVRVKARELRRIHDDKNHLEINTLQKVADKFPRKTKGSGIAPETAWERSELVAGLVEKLQKERASVLLIGEQGSGKTAILLEAARKFFSLTKERSEGVNYFWRTTPQRMIAGARYLGEWQETSEELMEELERTGDILWINDFVYLLSVGGEGPEDSVAAFMLPNLRQGRLQIVGELTQQAWEKIRQRLPGFAAHFHVITIPKLSKKQIVKIMAMFADYVHKQLHITIEKSALNLAYRLLDRYLRYEAFPGKIIKFMTSCVNEALVQNQKSIDDEKVLTQFVQKTGLPPFLLRDDMLLDTVALHDYFNKRIIGQTQAIERVCQIVMIFKAGLNDPNKPIATLLFAGPTGVGKTACATALAAYFFGQGQTLNPLIRLDMSEFQHPVQVDRLLGSGDKPGKLIALVRERPFSVVLLDEIEKAHPIFFDVLLNVMDEGILVDGNGRVTDFRNVILIMTSNLGAKQSKRISFVNQSDDNDISSAVRQFFRPEFYNRIDQVITFQALSAATVADITRKELMALNKREGFQERHLKLTFTPQLVKHLAKVGFDPKYGARPLQRTIERLVISKLAEFLLQHVEMKGVDLLIDWVDKEVKVCTKK
ncbi:MAG: ATP-dependent Clp protease ATP-binding subunit [Gammaproteobacteria bacterium]|nr:MAG: ATP-dependent Clp protease ATP-binding subunit [Gammaproteobacteria bacterium]RKZ42148.1 MAG: ATP-dependent Clp protease ATP-binding subunit [Gammaproteobacteria bacterium]RKZ76077.1 MAG: ATP-dependent Clp protease ATP-binding subunit [Gammaproteobacteria bacterium]